MQLDTNSPCIQINRLEKKGYSECPWLVFVTLRKLITNRLIWWNEPVWILMLKKKNESPRTRLFYQQCDVAELQFKINTTDWYSSWERIKIFILRYQVLSKPHVRLFSTSLKVKPSLNYSWFKYCSPTLAFFQEILFGARTNLRAIELLHLRALYIHKESYGEIRITNMSNTA